MSENKGFEFTLKFPYDPIYSYDGIVTTEQAQKVASDLRVDLTVVDLDWFRRGLTVELEHGTKNPLTNITGNELHVTAMIVLAHFSESKNYYYYLAQIEARFIVRADLDKPKSVFLPTTDA